jgi:hypothetical protein
MAQSEAFRTLGERGCSAPFRDKLQPGDGLP